MQQEDKKSASISIVKLLDESNSHMVLNPLKKESIENITPLPSYTELGLPLNSIEKEAHSFYTEIIPFECSCGKDLGIYLREISVRCLSYFLSKKEKKTSSSSLPFFEREIGIPFGLNGCCRLKVIAPIIAPVVSLDVNAKVVDRYEVPEEGYDWPIFSKKEEK